MAAKKAKSKREKIVLECTECKSRNYSTTKNKANDPERKELQKNCDFTNSMEEKARIQEEIQKISKKINKSWLELAQLEDEIEDRRYTLINNLKAEKDKSVSVSKIFELEWNIH